MREQFADERRTTIEEDEFDLEVTSSRRSRGD